MSGAEDVRIAALREAEQRLAALRKRLARRDIDRFIVVSRHNLRYLTAFEGLFGPGFHGLGVISDGDAVLVTDRRYAQQAAEQAARTSWRVDVTTTDPSVAAARVVDAPRRGGSGRSARGGRVAVELDVGHRFYVSLSNALGREPATVAGLVEALRRRKTPSEVDAIRRAARLTDRAFSHALDSIRPGMLESDLAAEVEFFIRREGAAGSAFPPIVASGPNASKPHAQAGARPLRVGELVKIDIGAEVDGYCADLTRTVAIGRVDPECRAVHRAVLEAQKRAIASIGPGMTGRQADRIARDHLRAVGLGLRFTHGLGHGVGLEVHEAPTLGPRSGRKLAVGDVFTVEPGVYFDGRFGVRIEDLVVLGEEGVHNLSRSPRRLITL